MVVFDAYLSNIEFVVQHVVDDRIFRPLNVKLKEINVIMTMSLHQSVKGMALDADKTSHRGGRRKP